MLQRFIIITLTLFLFLIISIIKKSTLCPTTTRRVLSSKSSILIIPLLFVVYGGETKEAPNDDDPIVQQHFNIQTLKFDVECLLHNKTITQQLVGRRRINTPRYQLQQQQQRPHHHHHPRQTTTPLECNYKNIHNFDNNMFVNPLIFTHETDKINSSTTMVFYYINENSAIVANARNIRHLRLYKSVLPVLTSEWCSSFTNITVFFVNNVNLRIIREDALSKCRHLKIFHTDGNYLKYLDAYNIFRYNVALETVSITNSNLQYISSKLFDTLPLLNVLNLSDNNLTELNLKDYPRMIHMKLLLVFTNDLLDLNLTALSDKMPNLIGIYLHNNLFECERVCQFLAYFERRPTQQLLFFNRDMQRTSHKYLQDSNIYLPRYNLSHVNNIDCINYYRKKHITAVKTSSSSDTATATVTINNNKTFIVKTNNNNKNNNNDTYYDDDEEPTEEGNFDENGEKSSEYRCINKNNDVDLMLYTPSSTSTRINFYVKPTTTHKVSTVNSLQPPLDDNTTPSQKTAIIHILIMFFCIIMVLCCLVHMWLRIDNINNSSRTTFAPYPNITTTTEAISSYNNNNNDHEMVSLNTNNHLILI